MLDLSTFALDLVVTCFAGLVGGYVVGTIWKNIQFVIR